MNWGSGTKSLNPRLPIRSAMNEELKVYLVGGVVRDALIAEQVADLKVLDADLLNGRWSLGQ